MLLFPMCPPTIPGDEVYSTIRKQEYNGKIPRFRRIRGESELYTSDTVMQSESDPGWVEGGPRGVDAQGGRQSPDVSQEDFLRGTHLNSQH